MQAVILSAGKGTRLAHLTEKTPKSLVRISKKPILEHILSSLPDAITDIFVITKHYKEHIHDYCASHQRSANITCIPQGEKAGTYGALYSAAKHLNSPFLVINGDDIYSQDDLEHLISHPRAFGVAKRNRPGYHVIEKNSEGIFENMRPQKENEKNSDVDIATGAYVLDKVFFTLPPAQMKNGEYGIPHTLREAQSVYPVRVVEMPSWIPINTPQDIENAKNILDSL